MLKAPPGNTAKQKKLLLMVHSGNESFYRRHSVMERLLISVIPAISSLTDFSSISSLVRSLTSAATVLRRSASDGRLSLPHATLLSFLSASVRRVATTSGKKKHNLRITVIPTSARGTFPLSPTCRNRCKEQA